MKHQGVLIIVLCICILFITSCNHKKENTLMQIDYSENAEIMKEYFPEFSSIGDVYFKSICLNANSRVVGPSTFNITGFMCISKDEVDSILKEFNFAKAEPQFQEGISPTVTGYVDFSWHSSCEFSMYVMKSNYVGEIYIDTNNCVIYVDVQTA